jgi:hypothetical protein
VYAQRAGFDYRLECGPFPGLRNPFYFKETAVKGALARYDWVIWMDDDAFFTDFDSTVFTEQLQLAEDAGKMFIVGDSPTNERGEWTTFNAGIFCIRNDPRSFALLDRVLDISLEDVKAWWKPEVYGKFTNGDQDSLVYAIETGGLHDDIAIIDHRLINARPYEYERSASDHFVCHFPGVADKQIAISEFGNKFDVDDTLMSAALRSAYSVPTGKILTARQISMLQFGRRCRRIAGKVRPKHIAERRRRTSA